MFCKEHNILTDKPSKQTLTTQVSSEDSGMLLPELFETNFLENVWEQSREVKLYFTLAKHKI